MIELISFDLETHLSQPGLAAPPIVCGSTAAETPHSERLLTPEQTSEVFSEIAASDMTIVGSVIDYDFGCMSAADPKHVAEVFRLLNEKRALDVTILEKLHYIGAEGGEALANAEKTRKINLAALELQHLGIDRHESKENGWRRSYALLDGVPFENWPTDAKQYPKDDAVGPIAVAREQLKAETTIPHVHDFFGNSAPNAECIRCGVLQENATGICPPSVYYRFNIDQVHEEMKMAWVLRLSQIWGMRTDPTLVAEVVAEVTAEHELTRKRFFLDGIVRVKTCTMKKGVLEDADAIDDAWLLWGMGELERRVLDMQEPADEKAWLVERHRELHKLRTALGKGKKLRFSTDTKRLKELVTRAYRGQPPKTDPSPSHPDGQISTSGDTLEESGDGTLEDYAEAGTNEKLYASFLSVIEQGSAAPITPRGNTPVVSQRTSYRDPNLQQLPRKGKIRYCFVPRGYEVVEVLGC